MNKSESIKEIAKALITFHIKVDKINKDAKNPFFKSAYASLSNILDAINDPLNQAGLSFCQFPSGEHGLTTILMHESGEYIYSEYFMRPTKDDPQGLGSAITYQRRYALSAILGLNIDEDDDGNAASKPSIKKQVIIPIGDIEIDELLALLATSTYEGTVKDKLFNKINSISTREDYDKAKKNLLDNQLGINGAVNPSQSEINKHIRKISQPA